MLRKVKILAAAAFLSVVAGCGNIDIVDADGGNTPSGTLVSQAEFSALLTVTGFASIYDQGGGSYVLRLESISGASSVYQVRVNASSGAISIGTLGITSGSRNFSFSTTAGATFTNVEILQSSTVKGRAIF